MKSPRVPPTLSPTQALVARMFGPLDGASISGGCDHCNAIQTVEPVAAGVWRINIHHDDDCPFYRQLQERAA